MTTGQKMAGIIGGGILIVSAIASDDGSSAKTTTPTLPTQEVPTRQLPSNSVTTPPPLPDLPSNKVSEPPKLPTTPSPSASSNCHPGYSGCLKMNAGDYDCAGGSGNGPNYTGPVRVYGSDPFGLDRDHDGWGCDS